MIIGVGKPAAYLLETSTLAKLFAIEVLKGDAPVLSASLKNRIVVYCPSKGVEARLRLCRFDDKLPKWTRGVGSTPSTIAILPSGTRLATFHGVPFVPCICIWDAGNGQLQAELTISALGSFPSDIRFGSETRFYSYHSTYRIPYDLNFSPRAPTTSTIIRHKQQPWTVESSERKYQVDGSREWVVRGSKRILWIPPGYLTPHPKTHSWGGSNVLVMVGDDDALRVFTFHS